MSAPDPRKMALQIAGLRANETHLPEDIRVFCDPYAEFFFPAERRRLFEDPAMVAAELTKYEQLMPGVNGAIVARICFIDDCLRQGLDDGVKQVVIVGAGYDTRPYRLEAIKMGVRVLEVDHPDTQAVKTATIQSIFGALPDHVTYVPVFFGADRLDLKLIDSGYDPGLKTLFIVEGLLMYIPSQAVDGLLGFIVNASGPGSSLVADYFSSAVVAGDCPLPEARALRQFVEDEGSALQFGLPEGRVKAFFSQRGFDRLTRISAPDCKAKYFSGASRQRAVSAMFNFVQAFKN